MKILLLGATGRTGKFVLTEALERGFEVHCLSRNSQRIQKQKGLTVFEGNPAKNYDLEKAMAGCAAVVSVLNISRHSDFPWSKLKTPPNYLSEVMKPLVKTAGENDIRRIVVCSAWGVADTKQDIPGWFRWFIENSNIGIAYKDHERQEKILSESGLDWTIVRPAGLTNFGKSRQIRETFGNEPKPSLTISRKSLAEYLVRSVERDDLIGKKVVVSKE